MTLPTSPSVAAGSGVVPTQGGTALSATNGGYTNILQGNAVLSTSNPTFSQLTTGAAVIGAVTESGTWTVTTKPTAGTFTIAGCSVGTSSAQCIATSVVTNHVLVENTSASANMACAWGGGTAILNSNGSVQLGPSQSALWGPTTSGVPSGAMNCIASSASAPLYVEYN